METDALKALWGEFTAHQPAIVPQSRRALSGMLMGSSATALAKVRTALRLEFVMCLLGIALMLARYAMMPNLVGEPYLTVFIVLVMSVLAVLVYRQLPNYQDPAPDADLRTWLHQTVTRLERGIANYIRLMAWIGPFLFMAGFLQGIDMAQNGNNYLRWFSGFRLWILLGMVSVAIVGAYYFSRWTIRRVYGCHLRGLKESLAELERE